MNQELFDHFLGPRYQYTSGRSGFSGAAESFNGELRSRDGSAREIPIVNSIPRFIEGKNYAENFGLQWNEFQSTQLDSHSGRMLSFYRFFKDTRWKPKDLYGKTVLEVGSGAGRFTEILLNAGARVVSMDYSDAVDANQRNNRGKGDLLLMQADLYDLPLREKSFDFVFCFGVLQHTPDVTKTFQAIYRMLKPGGRICVDVYSKTTKLDPWSTPKYFWRRWTVDMQPEKLLKRVRFYVPLWLPFDTLLRRIPKIGPKLIAFLRVPCCNYLDWSLTRKQRREWAIMDTFDQLGAKYDEPKTDAELREIVESTDAVDVEIYRGMNGWIGSCARPGENVAVGCKE